VSAPTRVAVSAPRWAGPTSLVLALLGVAVSAYLTVEHYSSSATLACPDSGVVDCVKVTTSSYAELFGVPVALLGLLYFVAMAALCLPVAWSSTRAWVHRARLVAVSVGAVFVLYLVWVELFRVDAICLWCTAVHVLAVGLFAVVALASALREAPA
jgi:uncharacterized membrane protein